MKKFILTLITLLTTLFSLSAIADASTLSSVDIYLKYNTLERMMSAEQTATSSIIDAGEERIDTYTGGVSYYSEELNLPGKNGFDVVVGRKFNSATDVAVGGESHYISVKDYRNPSSPTETSKYVFPYHQSKDCSDDPIFIAFDTVWHMLQAENGETSITISSAYEDEAINLDDTMSDYDWAMDPYCDAGFTFDDDFYIYDNIIGSEITLYRDLSKKYEILYSSRPASPIYVENKSYEKLISLGGGWEYDIPVVLSWDSSSNSVYDYMYGMFYDSYQKESVCYKIQYIGEKIYDASCYYILRPIDSSGSVPTRTKEMYTIEAEIIDDEFFYTITRNDGVVFNFYEYELLSMADRFGNTISFEYSKDPSQAVITDTLGRSITLTADGISVNNEKVVSYSFDRYNNDDEDPNSYYDEDDWGKFTASYKVGANTSKSIVYNHSQRVRMFKLLNSSICSQVVGYTKMVLDSIVLPTGAQRIYDYGEIERPQYFNSAGKTDYACISRYDLQADSETKENHQTYNYGEKSETPTTITLFPGRADYTISETFDSEGCVTTRVTECADVGYTITENYTYIVVDGAFRVDEESVTKVSTDGSTSSYVKSYEYDASTHNISEIHQDGTFIYQAVYTHYGFPKYEYHRYGNNEYRGIRNVISNKSVSKKMYVTPSNMTHVPSTSEETINYTYDEYGNLLTSDEDGIYVEYSYEYGDYSGETEPDYSLIITETYPNVDNITNSQGDIIPSANVTKMSYYDKWGNLVKFIDGEGNTTTYSYDYLGRLLTQNNPDNTTKKYQYNDITNRISVTNELGKRFNIRYDSLGREFAQYYLSEDATMWKLIYHNNHDTYSNRTKQTVYYGGGVDCVYNYSYYSDNSLKTEILKNGLNVSLISQNTYSYTIPDSNLLATTVTRKKNDTEYIILTNYTNQYGYKVKDTISDGSNEVEQVYTTDFAGNIKTVHDLRGNKSHTYTYDYRGRILEDTLAIGSTTNVYDGAHLYRVKNSLGNVVKTYEYNTMGQLISETTPVDDDVDNVTSYYYDRNGNLTKTVITTGDGTTTKTASTNYDNRNRPVAVTDGSSYYTRYEYNNIGNITRMATGVPTATEALDRDTHSVTDYEYSYRDFLIGVTDPMGYTESYTYNSRGTVLTFTDKNGTLFEYTYNGAPWLLSKTATGSDGKTQSVSYTYDYLGNITQMVDENGSTLYTYDRLGNILTETRGTLVKEYEYDANGNRTSADISDGTFEQSLTYVYNANNILTRVTDDNGYTSYTYDKNNRVLTEKTYDANDYVCAYTRYTYFDSGLVKTKKNYRYESTSLSSYLIDDYTLTYYADGNIATVDNNDAVTTYVYDSANRLLSESIDGTVQASYTYDAFGNRATMTNSTGVTTYTYDKNNRLTAENTTLNDGTTSYNYYCYNNDGTLQEKYWGIGFAYYYYDLFGQLTNYSSGGNGATYTYDGNGIRTSKTVGGVTTNFINDGAYVVGEVSGDSIIKYTYGTGLVSINNNGTVGYYHTDEHGNVSAITDSSRNVVADYDFDAFGNETVSTDSYYNPMRYCGEYFDAETGLIYLRARYYDPSIGRFISEDPIKDGTNWYVYCGNNPVMFVDPSGLNYFENLINSWMHKKIQAPLSGPINGDSQWENYMYNLSLKQPSGIIYNQNNYSAFKLGWETVNDNGCEAVALYNALLLTGYDKNVNDTLFSEVVYMCEDITMYKGVFGSNPYSIGTVLNQYGYDSTSVKYTFSYDEIDDTVKNSNVIIASFWNTPYAWDQLHTVAISIKDDGSVSAYNCSKYKFTSFDEFKAMFLGDGKFISLYALENQEGETK